MRMRLDAALVSRGLTATRARARDLILRGAVLAGGRTVAKAGAMVGPDVQLEITGDGNAYVSRSAAKLIAGLDAFGFQPAGRSALDVGASTGGFTQVLLERGAAKVWAVDVGHGQLAGPIAADPRVVNLEGMDARTLDRAVVAGPVDAIVADVSFIALAKALPAALALAAPGCWLVALVKPQFELGPAAIGKGGIVKDPADGPRALAAAVTWIAGVPGWRATGTCASPLPGKNGNQEYLLGAVFEDIERE
jgi:23S rRNA (cytidine1920-2'-O)/16S rRNA (cytidine1409-2'-O)-methyltransferase